MRYTERRKRPTSAGEILEHSLGTFHFRGRIEQYLPLQHWADIVGPELAQVSMPEKIIRKRVLVIRVLDSAWAQELALQKDRLLERLLAAAPDLTVSGLQFVTGDPRHFAPKGETV